MTEPGRRFDRVDLELALELARRTELAIDNARLYRDAQKAIAFLKEHQAPFELDDFSEFFAKVEEPATTNYRGYQVYKHGFGSQGPVMLEALNILENYDLKGMKHNSADYIHTVVEALKLAYADRDTYYGDQLFV